MFVISRTSFHSNTIIYRGIIITLSNSLLCQLTKPRYPTPTISKKSPHDINQRGAVPTGIGVLEASLDAYVRLIYVVRRGHSMVCSIAGDTAAISV